MNGFYEENEILKALEYQGQFDFCRKNDKYDVLMLCVYLIEKSTNFENIVELLAGDDVIEKVL